VERVEAAGIEPLARNDMGAAAKTLAQAFMTDPMFRWMFPREDRRLVALQRFIRVPLEYGLRYGHVMRSESAKAVAIWVPPERRMSMLSMARSGFLAAPFQIGLGPFLKFAGANQTMEKIHHRYVPEPHWYLLIVGVDPELQGQGRGGALVAEGLARADKANAPCYLDTSEERNLAFYERLGFKVAETAVLGKGGPPAWGMRREPQGSVGA
jgi:ribosomal protein S18 acetylase RimI-like enzyme